VPNEEPRRAQPPRPERNGLARGARLRDQRGQATRGVARLEERDYERIDAEVGEDVAMRRV
jgi:hypothetical protein